ncbi:MAG: pitrilysin family protein, partial [Gemmatimonadota bacterium]
IRSAVRGAGGYDAEGLADRIERMGGSLGTTIGSELWGFSTSILTEYLADASALLDLVMREPQFDPEAVLRERRLLEEIARQAVDDMYRHPIQLAFRAAFGDRGHGLPTAGYPETVAGLKAEMVAEWHRAAVAVGRVTVVAVGAFDPEQAAMTLAGVFGGRPDADATEPPDSHEWNAPDGERQLVVSREKAQTAIAMLFPGPGRRAEDRFAAEVWAAHAGGLGGRLFEALRDRRSLAYTVQAYSWQRRTGGGLVSYIATAPGRETEAREQMLVELERFAESESSAREIHGAIGYLVGQSEVRRQSASAIAGELLGAFLSGTGLEELGAQEAALRAVTPGAVRQLAARFLSPAARAEGVVRGRSPPA